QTVTENFALTVIPTTTISGVVRDGSGHGWPLAAQVQVAGQPTTAVHTDPVSGRYVLSVPQGAAYTVQVDPAYPGYLQDSQQVQVGKAAVGHDVGIKVDPVTCGAPGYDNKFSGRTEPFDGSSTPDGWTVRNDVPGSRPWSFDNPGGRTNATGGSGNFAITESNLDGGDQDTTLTSPVYDLSGATNPTLTFGTDFEAYADSMNASAEYTVDGGANWTPVWRQNTQDAAGKQVLPLPAAVGRSAVQVRFHYVERNFGFWWEVDDVFVGDHACALTPGGIVTGHVTDKVADVPLSGATVTSVDAAADKTTTGVDGEYWFFSTQTGTHPISAAATNYVTATKSATITPDSVTPQDFSLDSARLTVNTTAISKSVAWQGNSTASVKVTNTGSAPADVRLDPRPGGYTPAAQVSAPLQKVKGNFSTGPLLGKALTAAPRDTSPSAASWSAVADYPTKIMDNAAVAVNGKIYSFTGLNGTDLTTKNYVYDQGTQSWSPIADLKEARENPFAVAIGTKVYLAGGWGVSGPPNGDLEIYDTATNTWTTGAPMPKAYSAMGSAVVGGKVYVIGGCLQDSCGVKDVQVYDPATDTWSAGPSLPMALSWTNCGIIAGTLYCAGGASGLDYVGAGFGLNVKTGTWSPIASLPVSVFAASSTVANGQLLVSGGIQDGSLTNAGYAYDPSTNAWNPLPNANATLFRGGSACGFYRIGGSAGGFSPTTQDQLLPGYDQCGEYVSIPWMSVTPTDPVTIAPGKSASFTVKLDAASLTQPGAYTASLEVAAVVPHPVAAIPVTFTVKPPSTWGKITGTVTSAACKGGTPPIAGATVQIDTWAASYTLRTDANGNYVLWLDNRNNPLTLIVARDGWQPQTRQVKITKGKSVTADFALKPVSC
ncbi:carboxypeptidase regulatory-like domain-containing protein, partial [Kutzneria sp. 744]|uniref:Kelch repeat-containing protein n=1 Tax=Kutzneria sp. (strain 744) TaxID=345341 RepID=UPI0005B93D52